MSSDYPHSVVVARAEQFARRLQQKYKGRQSSPPLPIETKVKTTNVEKTPKPSLVVFSPGSVDSSHATPTNSVLETDSNGALRRDLDRQTPKPASPVKKKKQSADDFESLAIIGRGAFGEVRIVRRKGNDPASREVFGKISFVCRFP